MADLLGCGFGDTVHTRTTVGGEYYNVLFIQFIVTIKNITC